MVRERVTLGTQHLKTHSKEALLGRIFDLGVRKGQTILIGGTQRGKILMWGYAGTKRLITPGFGYFRLEFEFRIASTVLHLVIHCWNLCQWKLQVC